jgi:uncharacterized protein (DUF111 family)
MKALYLDCISGISGDMMVGALIDLGVKPSTLEWELSKLDLGHFHLHFDRAKRKDIEGVKFDIHGGATHQEHGAHGEHEHGHCDGCDHDHGDEVAHGEHTHKHSHSHSHSHEHTHSHEHAHAEEHVHGEHCDHGHAHEHGHEHDEHGVHHGEAQGAKAEAGKAVVKEEHHEHAHEHGHECCGHDHDHDHEHEHEHEPKAAAETKGGECHGHEHTHEHEHSHSHEHAHSHEGEHAHGDCGHDHDHDHGEHGHHHHEESRTYAEIRKLIEASDLSEFVKKRSLGIFHRIAVAEGKIHGQPPETVHFHEVGALDSIADIVLTCVGIEDLGVEKVFCSRLHDGHGTVKCAHGTFPVPAPATMEILRGIPLGQIDEPHELITPTGAAIAAEFAESFGLMPSMKTEKIGYGLGTRELVARPNVLRAVLGSLA